MGRTFFVDTFCVFTLILEPRFTFQPQLTPQLLLRNIRPSISEASTTNVPLTPKGNICKMAYMDAG